MKKISAAIIVKNEEDVIQRCIDCVSLFADEIVIVDTGSSDKTKEIAAENPNVKLFDSDHFGEWTHFSEFSFSLAKNEAIAKCTGDWIIWWDADDWVDQENADKIRNLAETTNEVCLYSFNVKYGPLSFEHCRLFKSGHNIKFDETHSVHEYLNTLGHPNYSRHEVVLEHRPGKKHMPSNERNIAIMEKDYYERGMDDPRTLFYLGNSYRECGRQADAVEFYKKYLEKSVWAEERFFACYYLSQALVMLGKYGEARQHALRAVAEDFRFAEAYCLLGDLALHENDAKRAKLWYTMATETPYPKDAKLFVAPSLYKEYPLSRLEECANRLKVAEIPVMPAEMQEKMQELIAPQEKTKNVLRAFNLPDEQEEAIVAAGALRAAAKKLGGAFQVFTNNEAVAPFLVDCDELVFSQTNDAVSLILPSELNGRPREEWYCRAAGFVFDDWQSVVTDAENFAEESRRSINVH